MNPQESNTAAVEETKPTAARRRWPLHTRILIGLLIGAVCGAVANYFRDSLPMDKVLEWTDTIGRLFLRLVFMIVLPLVVSALALGVLELGDLRRLGRVGARTLLFTFILSATSVAIGLGLVNLIQPGKRLSEEQRIELLAHYSKDVESAEKKAEAAKSLSNTLLDIIPENPLQEMVGALDGSSKGNGMLAVMFFALMLGIALAMSPERTRPLVSVLEGVFDVSMVIIGLAMKLAPYCVACLVFGITARQGPEVLATLFWFVATVVLGLSIQMFVVYSLVLVGVARRNPWQFFRDISDAALTAFGTSSSNATLPISLRVAREKLRLPPEISRFVLTVGATGNQNGTALYEGVVVLFLAQVFNQDLTVAEQFKVVLMSILAGVGTAGVPGGSIPLIMVVLRSVNVPPEGIAVILGVDRLCDMCRTVLNVSGDLVLATCVAGEETADISIDAAPPAS
ncbi:MAG TPA: dicarboxylate/amino acid:cation symporter [Pirellulales bacterium]|jgi:DAACS family dicarboxylate/amino acid:cation (Na+ or H+) symporter